MTKIKLVVFNEHTLGYIHPAAPTLVQHLHCSILKGGTNSSGASIIGSNDKVRLASEKDFDEFRVVFSEGYKNGEYEYAL